MSRPGVLLVILILTAVLAGFGLEKLYRANTAKPAPAAAQDGSSTTPDEAAPESSANASGTPAPPTLAAAESQAGAALEGQLLNEAYQVSKARSLQYQDALEFQPATPKTMQEAWQSQINQRFPTDTLSRLGLTLQCLGILPLDEDLKARYQLKPNFSAEVLYDALEGQLLHTENLNLEDPSIKEWSTYQLALMLLDQNFRWHEAELLIEVNFDQALAQNAFVRGDAHWLTFKTTQTDVANAQVWQRTDSLTSSWPPALRAVEFLPLREAIHFCQAVTGQDVALDSLYQRLPTSTAHLLHPDRYLEIPRWEPRTLKWDQLDVLQSEPRWENVIGELLIRAWLSQALSLEEASLFASGWEGDGVLLYQTKDEAPQLAWKSTWRRPETAQRFFDILAQHAAKLLNTDPTLMPTVSSPGRMVIDDLLRVDAFVEGNTVTLLRTTEVEWRDALEDLAERSSFQ